MAIDPRGHSGPGVRCAPLSARPEEAMSGGFQPPSQHWPLMAGIVSALTDDSAGQLDERGAGVSCPGLEGGGEDEGAAVRLSLIHI